MTTFELQNKPALTTPVATAIMPVHTVSGGNYTMQKITQANLFARPLPIGSTTPNTGAFTTLTTTGVATFNGNEFNLTGTAPRLFMQDNNAGVDAKWYSFRNSGGNLFLEANDDAKNTTSTGFEINRTGGTITNIKLAVSTSFQVNTIGMTPLNAVLFFNGGIIPAHSQVTTTQAMVGLTKTDSAIGVNCNANVAGLIYNAYCSASGVATLVISNITNAPIASGNRTYTFRALI